jgi:hypothetical protein
MSNALDNILAGRATRYATQALMQAAVVVDMQTAYVEADDTVWIFVKDSAADVADTVLIGVNGRWINIRGIGAADPVIGRHEVITGTVGLWQGDGSRLDTGGSSFDLSLQDPGSGTYDLYGDLWPGYVGFANVATGFRGVYRDATDAALRITGDMTIQAVCVIGYAAVLDRWIFAHGVDGSDGTEANNHVYGLKYSSNAIAAGLEWHQENGAGNDTNFSPGSANSSASTPRPALPPHGQPFYLSVTRTSGVVQIYINGKPWGPASNALTTPTGGTNGKLYLLCDSAGSPFNGMLASVRILNVTRAAADILADYNEIMGPVFGERE